MTWNSWMAPCEKVNGGRVPPRCSPKNEEFESAPSTLKELPIPRWPLRWTRPKSSLVAPGVSTTRSVKFRVWSGRFLMEFSLTDEETSVFVPSMTGTSPVTVTDWLITAILSVKSTRELEPSASVSPSRSTLWKPWSRAVTEYFPGGRSVRTYLPFESVAAVRRKPVSTLVPWITAPGRPAPSSSLTVPAISAEVVLTCARAGAITTKHAASATSPVPRQRNDLRFMFSPSPAGYGTAPTGRPSPTERPIAEVSPAPTRRRG